MRVAILGGTFDPPHVAHLVLGEAAHRQLPVDEVRFLPAGDPWQKTDEGVLPARVRLALVRAAVDPVRYFAVDDREVRRQGPSFTADTVSELRAEGVEPWLVLGADAAAGMRSWHRADDLRDVPLAIAARPGTDRTAVEAAALGPVTWLEMPRLDLSSTELRSMVAAGESLRFLVPDSVWHLILAEELYV
ncbi:MAG: nicotinate (nicotinamide) nucleotide adenylyltransferase [Acidimicrobiia bacterium]|nr:nicotinate (nicotinamide) nucleotide adenylyltransferase [Acidimicrobiia bacterium]